MFPALHIRRREQSPIRLPNSSQKCTGTINANVYIALNTIVPNSSQRCTGTIKT